MENELVIDLILVYNNTVMTNLYGKKIMKHLILQGMAFMDYLFRKDPQIAVY